MTHPSTTRLSSRLRLLFGLVLLLGLCALTGGLARPAHALTRLTVTNCSSDAQLQADVAQANSDNAGDVITFACSGDIKLTSTLMITGSLTLTGRGQHVTLDGGDSVVVLEVNNSSFPNPTSVTLDALTVAHGLLGLDNEFGNVTISNSTFVYNSAGALISGFTLPSSLTIINSTIADNPGGGINNLGDIDISNSTIADNSIFGIDNEGNSLSMSGSIVADNTGGDCTQIGFPFTDNGYNLSSDSSCGFTGTGDLQNSNPKLGPLASNGGPTQTMALLTGSPASDVIPLASGLCPATDQRGHKRPDNPHESACDIGAFES